MQSSKQDEEALLKTASQVAPDLGSDSWTVFRHVALFLSGPIQAIILQSQPLPYVFLKQAFQLKNAMGTAHTNAYATSPQKQTLTT